MTLRSLGPIARIGRGIGAQSAAGRAFTVLLSVATFAFVLAVCGNVLIVATYEGRAARDGARSPVAAADSAEERVWWSWTASSIDGQYVDVIHIDPLVDDAPLPPGLDRWPEPGEVVPAPALAADPAFSSWVAQVGWNGGHVIGPEGLTDAGERVAYHRPAGEIVRDAGTYVSGFGVPHEVSSGMIGSALRTKPLAVFLESYTAFVLVPALVLLLVVVRIDGRRRNARLAVLRVLGGSIRHRIAMVWGSSFTGVVFGAAVALVVLAVLLVADITVPVVGYGLRAADLRASALDLFVALLAALSVLMVVLFTANQGRIARAAHGAQAAQIRVHPAAAALCPFLTWVAVMAYAQAVPYGPNVTTLTYYAGVLLVASTLPLMVAGVTTGLSRGIVRWARNRARPATLVAARQVLFDSRGVLTIGASLAVVILLTVQVQIFSGKLSAQAVEAASLQQLTGDRLLNVELRGDRILQESARTVLRRHGQILLYFGSPNTGDTTVHITGSCAALDAAGLGCTEGPRSILEMTRETRAIVGLAGGQSIEVTVDDAVDAWSAVPYGWWGNLALVSPGPQLDSLAINTELADLSTPASTVTPISDSWLVAAADSTAKSRWLTVFGWCTVALLVLALGAASLIEQLEVTRSTRAWSVLGASRRSIAAVNGWRIALPMSLSVVSGALITVWLAQPILMSSQGGHFPADMLAGIAVVCLVITAGVWALATHLAIRDMERWHPGVTT